MSKREEIIKIRAEVSEMETNYQQKRSMKLRTIFEKVKSRDITLATKVCLVKATAFPVVRYGLRVGL